MHFFIFAPKKVQSTGVEKDVNLTDYDALQNKNNNKLRE
jgi:hypothetical protein